MQPTGNHSDKPEGLGSSRVEVVTNSCEEEADKGTSFAAREKCFYNYISGWEWGLRPFVEQTLGGDKDLHSHRFKNIQKHVALLQVLQTWKPFTLA